jgi:ribonuclease HII
MIVGIDEVGRGSWAGPICVAAVAWPDDVILNGLDDSKKVPLKKRVVLAAAIRRHAIDVGIGWAPAGLVDQLGVTGALKYAAEQALAALFTDFHEIIVDGNLQLVNDPRAKTLIKADCTIPAVMAASIVAKVARDNYMASIDAVHAGYEFSRHVGYGTKRHLELLQQLGPCVLHRLSYAPVKALIR